MSVLSATPSERRIPVALLGSSGIVAQRFLQRLAVHPWFDLVAVFGSDERAGKPLSENEWMLPEPAPDLSGIIIKSSHIPSLTSVLEKSNIKLVFSALPNAEAETLEPAIRDLGITVFSNSSPHRMDRRVPLVIPEVNPDHLDIISQQEGVGLIVCSTNCTVMPLAMTLKPILERANISELRVETEQSLSGGGAALLRRATAAGTVDGHISGEAEKMMEELLVLLGEMDGGTVHNLPLKATISCTRVMRQFGHSLRVEARLSPPLTEDELRGMFRQFSGLPQHYSLPSSPHQPIIVAEMSDEQAARGGSVPSDDENATLLKSGMAVVVSEIGVSDGLLSYRVFSENTVRGAAGGCMLLAELTLLQHPLL